MQHHQAMKRITTTVDPTMYRRLDEIARHDGVPTSRLLREAMERYVTERESTLDTVALPDWLGMLPGDGTPWAERDEELLERGWTADLEAELSPRVPERGGPAPRP